MQPSFISDFITEVSRTLKLIVVGISSASPTSGVRRELLASAVDIDLGEASILSNNCEIIWLARHYALAIDLSRHLGNHVTQITTVQPLTIFTIEKPANISTVDPSTASEIALLYVKFLRSSQQAISEVANQQYLATPSDIIGLRDLIKATYHLVGIDHISVLRSGLSGAVQILAQHGNTRTLQDTDANARDRVQGRNALAIALSERGHRHLSQKANDPLFPKGSSSDWEVIYVGAERYAADALKRSALNGVWYRASTANGALSWEQLALFNGLAQAMSVITSVGSILTARLIQLQRITHSNSSNLSAMHSTLAEAISGNASIHLGSQKALQVLHSARPVQADAPLPAHLEPQFVNIESLALQVREHLNYLKLNVQQMQAKITLSLWLEHEAGLPQQLSLERFNLIEVIGEIMSCAPALVESWASDYSGAARPIIDAPNRRDDVFTVKSRRDILSFVILNLLENAVKYRSSNRPTLKYVVSHGRDQRTYKPQVHILFADDGLGIDQVETHNIFDFGWRSPRHYRDIPGQGLGLYQCRELLRLVGGNIALSSPRNPTTFLIKIPIDQRRAGGS